MKTSRSITLVTLCGWAFVLSTIIAPRAVCAATWYATAGAERTDGGVQALAFLPNGLWIHVGDSITWTFPTPEIHTVTFLIQNTNPQQPRPNRPGVPGGGCPVPPGPATSLSGSSFDGSTCLTSPEITVDSPAPPNNTYTVKFPSPGNFKLVCLVHPNMEGAVHVLDPSGTLPFNQAFYDKQAQKRQAELLSDGAGLEGRATSIAQQSSGDAVSAGIGEIVATGDGSDTVSVMRFRQESIVVRVGDTVEWTNLDPVTPHTVTFGFAPPTPEPSPPQPPSGTVTVDSDGARHAVLPSPTPPVGDVHSGFIVAAPQDRGPPPPPPPGQLGLPQSPLGVTRFRVTFTKPGTFNYRCILHDDLGMTGQVIVHR
jgi:plastocyanin